MATVEIYSKSWCPYCRMAKRLLEEKGQEFVEFDVELDAGKYDEMLDRSEGRWTVPEIFIDGALVGGYDDLRAMEASGRPRRAAQVLSPSTSLRYAQDDKLSYPPLMKSATRSPIIMQVTLVLAWVTVGMMEASATRRLSMP